MNQYVSIFLGALVGYLFPYAIKVVVYSFKRFSKNIICGKWYCYLWWDNASEIEFAKMDVCIKRGIINEYKISYKDETVKFVGTCYIEDNNLCVEMKATDVVQVTSVYHRYELGTRDLRHSLYGFWLSYDANKKVSCGGAMLLRNEISNELVEKVVSDNYIIEKDIPLLRLKR